MKWSSLERGNQLVTPMRQSSVRIESTTCRLSAGFESSSSAGRTDAGAVAPQVGRPGMWSNVPVIERGNYSALQPLAEQWRAPPAERAHACHIGGNRHSELARGQWQVGRQYETKELWRQEHCDKACELDQWKADWTAAQSRMTKGRGAAAPAVGNSGRAYEDASDTHAQRAHRACIGGEVH